MLTLTKIENFAHEAERVILDLVAAFTPWLAPIIPAYLAYRNMVGVLAFPNWLALVGGAVVEFLGLAAVHTTFQFWNWNATNAGAKAPTLIAGATGAFYLLIVLSVNVILEAGTVPATQTLAKTLLSLISVAAGIVLALRAQHSRRMADKVNDEKEAQAERERLRQERREDRQAAMLEKLENAKIANGNANGKSGKTGDYLAFRATQMARNGEGPMNAKQVEAQFKVPLRTAYNWLAKYEAEVKHDHPIA